jgi:hypothetical protein
MIAAGGEGGLEPDVPGRLYAVLESLAAVRLDETPGRGTRDPGELEALVMAAGTLLARHLASEASGSIGASRSSRPGLFERGVAVLAGLLRSAPEDEGGWQPVLSQVGQVLGDRLPEQVAWLAAQGRLPAAARAALLDRLQGALEEALETARAPGRAGAVVGLHQIVQYAHQQRNMTILSDLAQGDPDDLVRGVARQALVRAMDANFDLVY